MIDKGEPLSGQIADIQYKRQLLQKLHLPCMIEVYDCFYSYLYQHDQGYNDNNLENTRNAVTRLYLLPQHPVPTAALLSLSYKILHLLFGRTPCPQYRFAYDWLWGFVRTLSTFYSSFQLQLLQVGGLVIILQKIHGWTKQSVTLKDLC